LQAENEGPSLYIKKINDFSLNEKLSNNNNINDNYIKETYNSNNINKIDLNNNNLDIKNEVIDVNFKNEIMNNESNRSNTTNFREKYLNTFPINNNSFNYLIVDSNLAIKENLNNIFFLEFELNKENEEIEKIKLFTEINNEKVNKDINFNLNVSSFFIYNLYNFINE